MTGLSYELRYFTIQNILKYFEYVRYLLTDTPVTMKEQKPKNCIFHSVMVKFLLNIYNLAELGMVAVIN